MNRAPLRRPRRVLRSRCRPANTLSDEKRYVATYGEVAASRNDAVEHYRTQGTLEVGDPTAFLAADSHRHQYPAMRDSGKSALGHYPYVGAAGHRVCQKETLLRPGGGRAR